MKWLREPRGCTQGDVTEITNFLPRDIYGEGEQMREIKGGDDGIRDEGRQVQQHKDRRESEGLPWHHRNAADSDDRGKRLEPNTGLPKMCRWLYRWPRYQGEKHGVAKGR